MFWAVPNGTYAFTVGSVAGYTANRTSGRLLSKARLRPSPSPFAPTVSSSGNGTSPSMFLGLPAVEGYGVLGGVIIAILVVTMLVVLLRRRGDGAPPNFAKSPPEPR